ncbi:MAG: MinD/ParA family protein [Bacillota bacterium]|jgi:flagellar biosynthesis protein FlhG
MNDQAERLRWLAKSLKEQVNAEIKGNSVSSRIFAVTSGKGGVGKTNLSLNLALAMIEYGKKVVLMDADMGTANIDVILGVFPQYNLFHVAEGSRKLNEIILEGPRGLRIIPGVSGIRNLANLSTQRFEQLMAELREFEQNTELMIIDTGAGISDNVIKFLLAADEVVVVTTPEPTSLTDAYALIKIVAQENNNPTISLIINRVNNEKEGLFVANKLKQATQRFLNLDINTLGYVVNDSAVVESVKKQQPFLLTYPKAPATTCVYHIAAQLCQQNCFKPKASGGFFNRVMRLLRR